MLALVRPSDDEFWPLAATQYHPFNRPANDNNITSGLCTRTKFGYDGLGRRLKQTVGAAETRYLWCGIAICQQRNGTDTVEKRFYAEGEYVHTGTKKYITLTDHLGSVRDVIDITTTPKLVAAFDYRPYGAVARSWGTVTTGYTYAGLFAQTNTGLLLSTTRAYNPANGKWLNVDPIREEGGINLTGYVGGGPMAAIDPEGKYLLLVGVVVGGVLVIHHWGRNAFNNPWPTVGTARADGWIVMHPDKSIFHMQKRGNQFNIKMISPDGRQEGTYDLCEWLINDPTNRGTYNYADPRFWGGVPHIAVDVVPYFILGNTPGDMLDPARIVTGINLLWGALKNYLMTLPASPGYGGGGGVFLGGESILRPQLN